MDSFHDEEAIEALTEQIIDALRPIGITVEPQMVQFGIQQNQMMVQLMGLVRPQAKERAEQDLQGKEEFNTMMAEQNRLMLEEERRKMEELAADPDAMRKFLFEDQTDCSHERTHEGPCLDCQAEVS